MNLESIKAVVKSELPSERVKCPGEYKELINVFVPREIKDYQPLSMDEYKMQISAAIAEAKGANCEIKNEINRPSLDEQIKSAAEKENVEINNPEKIKGNILERFMDEYFKGSSWSKLEGEIGPNGIDGLFIKRDANGDVKDVLVVESKYGSSQLGETENGKQMSKEWMLKKLDDLCEKFPENKEYQQIREKIQASDYRARIIRGKEENGHLQIEIKKIDNESGEVKTQKLEGKENYKINKHKDINLSAPENFYEEKIARTYEAIKSEEINKAIEQKKENK